MTALEPCPHCGNAHNEYQDYGFQHWISCPSCEMLGPDSPSEEEAAAAWNALPRPSDVTALKARAEAAEAERDRLAARVAELEAEAAALVALAEARGQNAADVHASGVTARPFWRTLNVTDTETTP